MMFTIAFSTPAADHGWLKAVSDNAKQAGKDLGEEVDLTVNDSAAGSAEQADQIETLIQGKPDVLVILPFEGDALTPVAQKAMDTGMFVRLGTHGGGIVTTSPDGGPAAFRSGTGRKQRTHNP